MASKLLLTVKPLRFPYVPLAMAFAQNTGNSEPLRLGLILDMSGPYADVTGPGSAAAAKMAVEDFGGKVLGRPIELLVADHQNKAGYRRCHGSRVVRRAGRRGAA